jgi:hypothetical protein
VDDLRIRLAAFRFLDEQRDPASHLYRYRGPDNRPTPDHPDNVGLREAARERTPLVHFHGIVPGRYAADYPVNRSVTIGHV